MCADVSARASSPTGTNPRASTAPCLAPRTGDRHLTGSARTWGRTPARPCLVLPAGRGQGTPTNSQCSHWTPGRRQKAAASGARQQEMRPLAPRPLLLCLSCRSPLSLWTLSPQAPLFWNPLPRPHRRAQGNAPVGSWYHGSGWASGVALRGRRSRLGGCTGSPPTICMAPTQPPMVSAALDRGPAVATPLRRDTSQRLSDP